MIKKQGEAAAIDFPMDDLDTPENKYKRFIPHISIGIAALGLVGVSVFSYVKIQESNRETKDANAEGLLRGRGFDASGIGIDVSGGAKKMTVYCEPSLDGKNSGEAITFFLDENIDAYLTLEDANGQQLGEKNTIRFNLQDQEQISSFVEDFTTPTCLDITTN